MKFNNINKENTFVARLKRPAEHTTHLHIAPVFFPFKIDTTYCALDCTFYCELAVYKKTISQTQCRGRRF